MRKGREVQGRREGDRKGNEGERRKEGRETVIPVLLFKVQALNYGHTTWI